MKIPTTLTTEYTVYYRYVNLRFKITLSLFNCDYISQMIVRLYKMCF